MRDIRINIEKAENGFVVEAMDKTWIADSGHKVGEVVREICLLLDGKDDLREFEKGVEEFVDAMKGANHE
jgi:hypothetical protein